MKYYLKNLILPYVYLACMALSAYGIMLLGVNWLKTLLGVLNVVFFITLSALLYYKEGESSVKVLHANDIEREQLIRTGECGVIKYHEEYKPYKGFLFGIYICVPLIICMIIHLILMLTGGPDANGAAVVAESIYLSFYLLINVIFGVLSGYSAFYLLLLIPLMCLVTGVPYLIGAKKSERQFTKIKIMDEYLHNNGHLPTEKEPEKEDEN